MRFGGPGEGNGSLGLPATLAIDKSSIDVFEEYVHEDFEVDYLMAVTSQYGTRLVSIFAFGSFPEGYDYAVKEFGTVERLPLGTVREPVDTEREPEPRELPLVKPRREQGESEAQRED